MSETAGEEWTPELQEKLSADIMALPPAGRAAFCRALSSKFAWDSASEMQRLAAIDVVAGIMPHPRHNDDQPGFNVGCAHCCIHYLRAEVRRLYEAESARP